jgi:hypothetical protein
MSRRLTTIFLWLAIVAAGSGGAHAEEGCPTGQLPESLDKKCTPISKYGVLPLDDSSPMRFEALQISMMIIWAQGTGVITKDTPSEFQKFLASDDARFTRRIALHSPGGNLMAGLELGK